MCPCLRVSGSWWGLVACGLCWDPHPSVQHGQEQGPVSERCPGAEHLGGGGSPFPPAPLLTSTLAQPAASPQGPGSSTCMWRQW